MLGFLKKLFSDNSAELEAIINDGAYLVDVRTTGEFRSGSVKGAVNIPLNTLQSNLSKFKNKKNVVVFCASGMRSSQAKAILSRNGVPNVHNGGAWHKVNRLKK
ncbi:MAG: rhodanese-like domain-containing protein [Sphingobacteriales bacterium]|jgi:rhodanese-related sulfurtransferase|nr:rhodanese-like domain-containing protein [Sphingobacteriales bacterium]